MTNWVSSYQCQRVLPTINDRVNQANNDAYETNLVHFIRDVRKELGVKDLPFIIAETYLLIGDAMANEVLELVQESEPKR